MLHLTMEDRWKTSSAGDQRERGGVGEDVGAVGPRRGCTHAVAGAETSHIGRVDLKLKETGEEDDDVGMRGRIEQLFSCWIARLGRDRPKFGPVRRRLSGPLNK